MKEKLRPWLLLAPILLFLTLVFTGGLITALLQSLGYFPVAGLHELTLRYFSEALHDRRFWDSLSFSLYVSLVSSVFSTFLGVLLAWAFHRMGWSGGRARSFLRLPIIVPHLITVLFLYNIFSSSGLLPRILYTLGLLADPSGFPTLLYDENGLGIILAYLWKETPFVALTCCGILARMSSGLYDAARNLGASETQAFRHVTLPLLAPTVRSSFLIIFAFSFGAYEVPLLLGPTRPKTLPVRAYLEYSDPFLTNRPYAMTLNVIITMIALFLTWLYYRSFQKVRQYEE